MANAGVESGNISPFIASQYLLQILSSFSKGYKSLGGPIT